MPNTEYIHTACIIFVVVAFPLLFVFLTKAFQRELFKLPYISRLVKNIPLDTSSELASFFSLVTDPKVNKVTNPHQPTCTLFMSPGCHHWSGFPDLLLQPFIGIPPQATPPSSLQPPGLLGGFCYMILQLLNWCRR